jgi:hypothetical protein
MIVLNLKAEIVQWPMLASFPLVECGVKLKMIMGS